MAEQAAEQRVESEENRKVYDEFKRMTIEAKFSPNMGESFTLSHAMSHQFNAEIIFRQDAVRALSKSQW